MRPGFALLVQHMRQRLSSWLCLVTRLFLAIGVRDMANVCLRLLSTFILCPLLCAANPPCVQASCWGHWLVRFRTHEQPLSVRQWCRCLAACARRRRPPTRRPPASCVARWPRRPLPRCRRSAATRCARGGYPCFACKQRHGHQAVPSKCQLT